MLQQTGHIIANLGADPGDAVEEQQTAAVDPRRQIGRAAGAAGNAEERLILAGRTGA